MGTFAKVLAVVNVVAALGFVCLAATDYARRRSWEFTLLAQDFQYNGLAVDDKQKDAEGQSLKELAGKTMQQALGATVSTQIEEVDARHTAVLSAINGAADKKAEVVKFVLPLARN